ncbi:hypothetical protein B0H10DRAFT_2173658 [Mycena sp. CBHHK59/15]|nr:hypothetical protein B0H10DRAFT_2173658 [Mycena sp. CBHHK59/15]
MSANMSAPASRASLLSGLRTGGVRSTSNIPHTAAPGGSFNVPRLSSQMQSSIFQEEDDDLGAQFAQNVFVNHGAKRTMPMTAAVDGPNNRFMQQQQDVNANIGSFSPAFAAQPNHVQAQALQMQMMQLEILRMQTIQAQQYQTQLLAQSQQQNARRPSYNPPATAGPLSGSFDLRSATLSAQMRRNLRPQADEEQVPMTAALGGKFGSRPSALSSGPMGRFSTEDYDDVSIPATPNFTTVISGGTPLGAVTPNNNASGGVSKSESASTWRRSGNNNSVLRAANRPVVINVSPPTERRVSPPPTTSAAPQALGKSRPQPLHFNAAVSQPMPAVAVDSSDGDNEDGYSTSSSESAASNSPPTTPRSSSSVELNLSPSKEGAKALPAGLGIGRPSSIGADRQKPAGSHRLASQPMRQPRGPPSGPDELGSRNFALRMMHRATVGLAY